MNPNLDLDAERHHAITAQAELAAADPPFAVIACPGAGKTRLIVDRHINRPVPARKGRAITSFTRVAAAEINRRCDTENRLDLTDHPHFVGTFDTFLWLHLVRPFLKTGTPWQRLDSWRDAPAEYRPVRVDQSTYQLEDIQFEPDINGIYSVRLIGPAKRIGEKPGWKEAVLARRSQLAGKGYLTGAELRSASCRHLRNHGPYIARILTAKYDELIVDEAQDCSATDLHILTTLYEHGVPLVVVADPDQAIYDFRGAGATNLTNLTDRLGPQTITRNWRSTSTICRLAATLRSTSRPADTAIADHHADDAPILLYNAAQQDAAVNDFLGYAASREIAAENCMILAHARATLPKKHAGPAQAPSNGSAALIWSTGILNEFPGAPTKSRELARSILARTVLRWWYPGADSQTLASAVKEHGLDLATLDRLFLRIRTAMPPLDQPTKDWLATATKVLNEHPPTTGLSRTTARLSTPKNAPATARKTATLPNPASSTIGTPRISTVHHVKGDQAEAVLVCMPQRPSENTTTTMEEWLGTQIGASESIRVLYVAVTRARRLLGLAVPIEFRGRLAAYLNAQGIPTAEH